MVKKISLMCYRVSLMMKIWKTWSECNFAIMMHCHLILHLNMCLRLKVYSHHGLFFQFLQVKWRTTMCF
jgi:hypothetical protein